MNGGQKMLYEYPAIFHKVGDSYQIEFPDFGRSTTATSLPLAMEQSRQFLVGLISTHRESTLPTPTPVTTIPNDRELVVLVKVGS